MADDVSLGEWGLWWLHWGDDEDNDDEDKGDDENDGDNEDDVCP